MTNELKPLTDAEQLRVRSAQLARVAAELKTELHGIDTIIDRVIEAIRAWYVLPHIISRPVIVCLWGLTGTGKTQLTRSLAQKLDFYDRFVEVQMDGFSHGSNWRSSDSISAMLAESGIEEGAPGILVLDEFQRFRTVNEKGQDCPVKRYQDVWQLLSDGRLPPALSFLQDIETSLAYAQYDLEREDESDGDSSGDAAKVRKYKFQLTPYQAQEFKRSLKLKESLQEIMTWKPDQLQTRMLAYRQASTAWETDYSRLLIFVAGNLDEMYKDTASRVEDCDTDADIFHALTQKLSVIDVKKALSERFRPEQIARLGNNHVVYPSLNRAAYERLIRVSCARYVNEIHASSGLRFALGDSVYEGIYANGVFPAQGTRPLFSSIHAILSAPLVNATLWAYEQGLEPGAILCVDLNIEGSCLRVSCAGLATSFPVPLDLNRLRQRSNSDFRALLAVHEAGHGLVHGRLFGHAPMEVKINVASFEGGYNSYAALKTESWQDCLNRICVSLAGRAAEELVYGAPACTTGSESDLKNATALAARCVRHYGFGGRLSRTDITSDSEDNLNTDVAPTNDEIEGLLLQQYARAMDILRNESRILLRVVRELMAQGELAPARMAELLGVRVSSGEVVLHSYAEQFEMFAQRQELTERTHTLQEQAPPAVAECESLSLSA